MSTYLVFGGEISSSELDILKEKALLRRYVAGVPGDPWFSVRTDGYAYSLLETRNEAMQYLRSIGVPYDGLHFDDDGLEIAITEWRPGMAQPRYSACDDVGSFVYKDLVLDAIALLRRDPPSVKECLDMLTAAVPAIPPMQPLKIVDERTS